LPQQRPGQQDQHQQQDQVAHELAGLAAAVLASRTRVLPGRDCDGTHQLSSCRFCTTSCRTSKAASTTNITREIAPAYPVCACKPVPSRWMSMVIVVALPPGPPVPPVRMYTSLKTRNAATEENMAIRAMVLRTPGTVTDRNWRTGPAPSTAAAS